MSTAVGVVECPPLGTRTGWPSHDVCMSDLTPDATVIDLQQQIDLLRAEVELLRHRHVELTPAPAVDSVDAPRSSTRRGVLKLAGATAAGALASAARAGRAAADTGYTTGGSISVGDVVRQQLNGSRPGEAGFLFATVSTPALTSNLATFPSALAGWSLDGVTEAGVHGVSDTANGKGVVGEGEIGVYGASNTTGVAGVSTTLTSTGVSGSAGRYGVTGEAMATEGVGVRGAALGDEGIGVYGNGGYLGVRGYTEATNGIGGSFAGRAGALQVSTWLIGAPPDRGIAFEPGVIEADAQGDLWFCYKGGNPGNWRKITGRSTAGAFHAVSPGRVYDSRAAAPSPGAIASEQSRTISVADKRDVDDRDVGIDHQAFDRVGHRGARAHRRQHPHRSRDRHLLDDRGARLVEQVGIVDHEHRVGGSATPIGAEHRQHRSHGGGAGLRPDEVCERSEGHW